MRRSVCVVSEDLSPPLDEGIKLFAHSLIQSWSRECRVLGLSVRSRGQTEAPHSISVRTNRLLLSYKLWTKICRFKPDILCYIPSPSATIFSFLRSRVLKLYWPRTSVIMVSLQPRNYGPISRRLIGLLSPKTVFVQDEQTMRRLLDLRCRAKLLPSGVNLEKFRPVLPEKKAELRTKYGLDPGAFTVLHVGHITAGRNIELLTQIQGEYNTQVVLVGSSLNHKDRPELTSRLKKQGIIVFEDYFSNIEELYQLSDCYLFPVFYDQACIGTPLSVLEAMACNLPVVTVRYGSLPMWFQEGQGLLFADTSEELLQGITKVKSMNGCYTRDKVIPYSWQNIARQLLNPSKIEERN